MADGLLETTWVVIVNRTPGMLAGRSETPQLCSPSRIWLMRFVKADKIIAWRNRCERQGHSFGRTLMKIRYGFFCLLFGFSAQAALTVDVRLAFEDGADAPIKLELKTGPTTREVVKVLPDVRPGAVILD